ncbi:MAG: extracellular solute-binding protein [Alphaproteobacteria bacterium]
MDPLVGTLPAFRARHAGIAVAWDVQPLAGFESEPLAALARRYDLIVFDHPHIGAVAQARGFLPLDDVVAGDDFVGPSLAAYRCDGRLWGVPIDAACQVAVFRPDLLARLGADVPRTWDDVLRLGERAPRSERRLAIALKGVHALMTFYTLCAGLGSPCATRPDDPFADRATARAALGLLRRVVALAAPGALETTSVGVHDALGDRDDLVYCPAVYGFATYAEADRARPLRFADLPGHGRDGPTGSTIGGAGIGVAAATDHPAAALSYVRFLAEAATQKAFARHHGQPAHRSAWQDTAIDARFGGFFSATRATIDAAWVRPRYAGYIAFQRAAGDAIAAHLGGAVTEADLIDRLERLHAAGEGG